MRLKICSLLSVISIFLASTTLTSCGGGGGTDGGGVALSCSDIAGSYLGKTITQYANYSEQNSATYLVVNPDCSLDDEGTFTTRSGNQLTGHGQLEPGNPYSVYTITCSVEGGNANCSLDFPNCKTLLEITFTGTKI